MKRTLTWMGVVFGIFVAACTKEASLTAHLTIAPTIAARATALNFEPGDGIGLRIDRGTERYKENAPLIYDGSTFSAAELVWYANQDEATLAAYYPYDPSGFPTEWSIATDQTLGYEESDLLGALRMGVRPTEQAVQMTFRHLMTRLQVEVQHEETMRVASVSLGGVIPTATLDWAQLTATPKSGVAASEVTLKAATACYEAILVPQSTTFELVVTTDDNKRYTKQIEAELLGGKSYKVHAKIENERLVLLLSGEIDDWEDGGEIGGGEETPEEQPTPDTPSDAATVSWGGESYATRTLGGKVWMAENLRYLPAGATIGTGVWYPSGQAEKSATLGLLYSYTTATSQQICPNGWHLPTKEELTLLIGIDGVTDLFTPAGICKPKEGEEPSYPTTTNYLMSATSFDDMKCYALKFSQTAEEITTVIKTNGYSVRCVKDE
ncbi:MAG: fimbrillin family protein [Alistipes sp.]|nr:fimbrillin family protein [Alistipes sp.]